jgi:hypothetical protein
MHSTSAFIGHRRAQLDIIYGARSDVRVSFNVVGAIRYHHCLDRSVEFKNGRGRNVFQSAAGTTGVSECHPKKEANPLRFVRHWILQHRASDTKLSEIGECGLMGTLNT